MITKIFTRAAEAIIQAKLGNAAIDNILYSVIWHQLQPSVNGIYASVSRQIEAECVDLCREEIRKGVERCLGGIPLDAYIKNRIEDDFEQQLPPRIERSVRDIENKFHDILYVSIKSILEENISEDDVYRMIQAEILKISDKLPRLAEVGPQRRRKPHKLRSGKLFKHKQFDQVMTIIGGGPDQTVKIMMFGPAGSGKTIIAEMAAHELGLPFYFNGPVQSEYKLLGYKDAHGVYQRTAFREAFEFGGVFLFDEFDACSAQAMVAFNTALSNKRCDFPDRNVLQHPNFICIAAANTPGAGANVTYSGRERLDGATLDRFAVVEISYDSVLEKALSNDDDWVEHIQKVRQSLSQIKPEFIVSMRASIEGAKLLSKGMSPTDVESAVIWRGRLTPSEITNIRNVSGAFTRKPK